MPLSNQANDDFMANARKINEGGISSTDLSLTDTVNKTLHRLTKVTLPLSFNLFVIGSKNYGL